jgi:hypothetical protein
MSDEEPPRPSGLPESSIAPIFDTKDVYGNVMNLERLLETYNGVLIDFFRGNW